VGRKVGRTVYAEEPGTDGRLIGVMDRREDARLASAAPELLTALTLLVAGVEVLGVGAKIEPAYDMACAAIAKAEGEAP
jgi:hypothetical protein